MAARYGVNISDLQDIIETAIGGQNLGVVIEGRMRFPIRMRYQKDYRDDVDEIKNLIVPVSLSSPMNVQTTMNNNSSIGMSNNSGGMSSMGSSSNAGV